jgi:2-keto-3-deoxy-6-phosphogluconate aldolase
MHLIAVGAKRSVTGGIVLLAIAAVSIHPVSALRAQARDSGARRAIRLPQESAGIEAIATALMGAFDQVDLVALGEVHERRIDSDLRIALVRHPGFAKKVRSIAGSPRATATVSATRQCMRNFSRRSEA